MIQPLVKLIYDNTQTSLVDGRVSVNYESILQQLENDENVSVITCGDNPNTEITITIVDSVFSEWLNRSIEDKAYIIDTAIYLDQEFGADKNNELDYGEIMTAIISGA